MLRHVNYSNSYANQSSLHVDQPTRHQSYLAECVNELR